MTETLPRAALSVRQPWAWLIVNGHKDIENRDWWTRYRGPVLIHAGKAWGPDERDVQQDLRDGYNPANQQPLAAPGIQPPAEHHLGGIVGVVDIVGCVTASASPWYVGQYGFVLANARPLPFVPCRGQLGFFDVPAEVFAALTAVMEGDDVGC